MTSRVAIDVGGTFTDIVLLLPEDDDVRVHKTPTTVDPIDGVLTGIRDLFRANDLSTDELSSLTYGTTAAVNALLTREGARVGLLTTEGFGHILHLARSQTPGPLVGWMNMIKPLPLADLADTREARERMRSDGTVEIPLDEQQLRAAVHDLLHADVDSFAVGFLHSYANPAHEQRAGELIADIAPAIRVSLSSELHGEYREYDRVVTTVANAFVAPAVAQHLETLDRRLAEERISSAVDIVRSDGGLMSTTAATDRPIDTVFSGPSGGVTGALAIAKAAGFSDILTLDMGGTSTDVSVCRDGEVAVARETIVGELPLKAPSVDVRSIGAGGGSIARVPTTGDSLRVGPDSAGANPGPACYGRGGTSPTVTDANLVLGRLPTGLLGGAFHLDTNAATTAISGLANHLALSVFETARGIIDIVNEKMAGALRVMSVERGLDPREFALVAFGGAGPLHANALAVLLGCYPVVVPQFPGVLSALGFHAAGKRSTFSQTTIRRGGTAVWAELESSIEAVGDRAKDWLSSEPAGDGQVHFSCDMRFVRQGYEVEIPFSESEVGKRWTDTVTRRFRTEHERLYGFVPDADVEVVTVRAEGRCPSAYAFRNQPEAPPGDARSAIVTTESVRFGDAEAVETPVYDRARLTPHAHLDGPGIIIQPDATTLVLPEHVASIDEMLNIVIQRAAQGNAT